MSYLLENAQLDWDGTTPLSTHYDDIYWHRGVPLEEKSSVFISPLKRKSSLVGSGQQFTVAELGFGFGINVLLAADAWAEKPVDCQLNIVSIEKHPVRHDDLEKLLEPLPLKHKADLLQQFPPAYVGQHVIWLADNIRLLLIFNDVARALSDLQADVDLWFLDGFSPAKNPDMWQTDICRKLFARSKPGAGIATYSASSRVREALGQAGFHVSKKPGFGRKKEMLAGHRPGEWHASNHLLGETVVIGAGLAGSFIHEAAERRSQQLTIVDDGQFSPSDIPQLSVLPQLAVKPEARYRFSLLAHQYMQDCPGFYRSGLRWHGRTAEESDRLQVTCKQFPDELMYRIPDGAEFPQAGWFSLVDFQKGQTLNIREAHIKAIKPESSGWRCLTESGDAIETEQVVLTTGGDRSLLPSELQVRAIRGQAITFPSMLTGSVVNGDATIFPAQHGRSVISGTYDRIDSAHTTDVDSEVLLTRAGKYIEVNSSDVHAMAGVRAVSRDRLPIVGAEPDWRTLSPKTMRTMPSNGKYLCTAFGSRGANHARLCAEHLISQLMNEPAALSLTHQKMLSPARFALRDFKTSHQTHGH